MSKADAWKKKMKLKVADKVTGSADRGYRAVGGTGLKGKSRRAIGRESEQIVQGISADPSVYDLLVEQLTQVRTAAENSGLAFIAASVLIAVDEQPAAESPAATAKLNLIDFAHTFGPEQLSEEQVKKYRTRFDKGMTRLIADVKAAARPRRRRRRKPARSEPRPTPGRCAAGRPSSRKVHWSWVSTGRRPCHESREVVPGKAASGVDPRHTDSAVHPHPPTALGAPAHPL